MSKSELNMSFPTPMAICERFRRDGHVVVRSVASAESIARYRSAIVDTALGNVGDVAPLDQRDTYGKAFLQVHNLWRLDPTVAEFTLAPRFGAVAADLLGVERVRLYHDQALFKEPGGGRTPWHQDASYWPLDGSQCITMWMPLVDIDDDMGGLCFAQGTGTTGPLTNELISDDSDKAFESLLEDGGFTVSEPTPMRLGDASFHRGWTAHKALENRSDTMREVMTVIWLADGIRVEQPDSKAKRHDLDNWLPGCEPGQLANSPINPMVQLPDAHRS